jgi:hypothetical protein
VAQECRAKLRAVDSSVNYDVGSKVLKRDRSDRKDRRKVAHGRA